MFLSAQQNQQQAVPTVAASHNHLTNPGNNQFIQNQQQSVLINPTTYHLQHSIPKPFNIPQPKTASIPSQNFFNTGSFNSSLYPTPSSNISHIKPEMDDTFANMQTDMDFNINDTLNMMSPNPASPLEISPPDFDGLDELNKRNSNSMANSPYGTSPLVISQPVNIVGSNHYHNIGEETVFETIPQINSFTGTTPAINVKSSVPTHLTQGLNNGLYSMSMPVNGTNANSFFNQPNSYGSYTGDITLKSGSLDFLEELDGNSKQLEILNEKRRRRRESHNAVERRRRDNINEKIHELSTLIPEHILNPNNGEGPVGKPNKGIILRKSVEYIKHLQALVEKQEAKNKELEEELEKLKQK
ncbi:HLH-domain-containing protein [Piromyces finnis]|uniref:HLH-domain-containing protein n=1 Tax=Piromyces finnis TaxID=1754191 RepID=A0A1Y1V1G8_9FUNG|nr:HLH-domain-containing protein [Piromyces finnis]|eukprot:ORX45023.1 HLH-domain-containing protein [Piromyces finnis]